MNGRNRQGKGGKSGEVKLGIDNGKDRNDARMERDGMKERKGEGRKCKWKEL